MTTPRTCRDAEITAACKENSSVNFHIVTDVTLITPNEKIAKEGTQNQVYPHVTPFSGAPSGRHTVPQPMSALGKLSRSISQIDQGRIWAGRVAQSDPVYLRSCRSAEGGREPSSPILGASANRYPPHYILQSSINKLGRH